MILYLSCFLTWCRPWHERWMIGLCPHYHLHESRKRRLGQKNDFNELFKKSRNKNLKKIISKDVDKKLEPHRLRTFLKQIFALFNVRGPFRTFLYQRVRNVRFSENLTGFVFLKHPFWDSPFWFITDDLRS